MLASAIKPIPVTSQASSAGPGAAAAEMSVESANTPEPMDELMTRAISPTRLMPFLRGGVGAVWLMVLGFL